MIAQGRTLAAEAADYSRYRGLSRAGAYRLRWTVGRLSEWLGREVRTQDLQDETISEWIVWLEQRYSQKSVYGLRVDLLTLWRDVASRGLVDFPGRVRRVRKCQPAPIAWTLDEVRQLLGACASVPGVFRRTGAARSDYLVTVVHAAYESGLRRSDLWRLRREQIRPDGTIVIVQHKTGRSHFPSVQPATAEKICRLPGVCPLACPVAKATRFYRLFRRVVESAGIRPGCLQQLRRTGATHLASQHPEAVQHWLGHSSPEMRRHYVDWSIAQPHRWLPPALD